MIDRLVTYDMIPWLSGAYLLMHWVESPQDIYGWKSSRNKVGSPQETSSLYVSEQLREDRYRSRLIRKSRWLYNHRWDGHMIHSMLVCYVLFDIMIQTSTNLEGPMAILDCYCVGYN